MRPLWEEDFRPRKCFEGEREIGVEVVFDSGFNPYFFNYRLERSQPLSSASVAVVIKSTSLLSRGPLLALENILRQCAFSHDPDVLIFSRLSVHPFLPSFLRSFLGRLFIPHPFLCQTSIDPQSKQTVIELCRVSNRLLVLRNRVSNL
jgi:hypothetical protein